MSPLCPGAQSKFCFQELFLNDTDMFITAEIWKYYAIMATV